MKRVIPFLVTGILAFIGCGLLSHGLSDKDIEHRVVKIVSEHGSCTGEQVRAPSGEDYILSAAHCRVLESAAGNYTIITSTGRQVARRFIAEDDKSDLLLIEGLPKLDGLTVAPTATPKQIVRTFTHGHGFDTYKTEGALVQDYHVEIMIGLMDDPAKCAQAKNKIINVDAFGLSLPVCLLSVDETVTTAFISPGSSGGPVVDSVGRLVGVVSAGGEGYGFLVRLSDIQSFLAGY